MKVYMGVYLEGKKKELKDDENVVDKAEAQEDV